MKMLVLRCLATAMGSAAVRAHHSEAGSRHGGSMPQGRVGLLCLWWPFDELGIDAAQVAGAFPSGASTIASGRSSESVEGAPRNR